MKPVNFKLNIYVFLNNVDLMLLQMKLEAA